MNRGTELTSGYKKTSVLAQGLKGKRHFIVSSLLQTQAVPEDIYSVDVPALKCI